MKTYKKMTDTFCETLLDNFAQHCHQQRQSPQVEELLTYLLDRDLIQKDTVRKYTVLEVFAKMEQTAAMKKTELVHYLAERFQISVRSIWSILSKRNKKKH